MESNSTDSWPRCRNDSRIGTRSADALGAFDGGLRTAAKILRTAARIPRPAAKNGMNNSMIGGGYDWALSPPA